jgi:hypothetical protein
VLTWVRIQGRLTGAVRVLGMISVEAISIPPGAWGRRSAEAGAVVPRCSAENEWPYVSSEPAVYTLEDFWEEALVLRSSLEKLGEPWGE